MTDFILFTALKSVNNDYYLNAEWIIDWPKAYEVSGTTFKYERPDNDAESLTALGPINEELVVMVSGSLTQTNLMIS